MSLVSMESKSYPAKSWSGRGKKPVWPQEFLDKGAKLEDFSI